MQHPYNLTNIQKCIKNYENFQKLPNLAKKYRFLYQEPWWQQHGTLTETVNLYMIHKIEIYPHYTYPTISNQFEHKHNDEADGHHQNDANMFRLLRHQDDNHELLPTKTRMDSESSSNLGHLLPPYRTVSHYGFNYPSTYMPTFALHPACSMTSVDLQRQKVIAFIKRLNLEAQAVENANKSAEHEEDEEEEEENVLNTGKEENIYENTKNLQDTNVVSEDNTGSFISVKEIQLNTGKQRRASILSHHSKSSDHQQIVTTTTTRSIYNLNNFHHYYP